MGDETFSAPTLISLTKYSGRSLRFFCLDLKISAPLDLCYLLTARFLDIPRSSSFFRRCLKLEEKLTIVIPEHMQAHFSFCRSTSALSSLRAYCFYSLCHLEPTFSPNFFRISRIHIHTYIYMFPHGNGTENIRIRGG